jgi:hypothetical protein
MIRLLLAVVVCCAANAWAQKPDAGAEALRMEMVFWESVRGSSDPADFRAYLEQYPNGKFAALARNRLAALTPKPAAPAAPAAAPAPAAAATAAKVAGPGGLSAGNTWSYRVTRDGSARPNQEVRIASVSADTVVEDILGEGPALRLEHRRGAYLVPLGDMTMFSPYLGALDSLAPRRMSVDNLDSRTCNAGWSCSVSARIVGSEQVRVPAGTSSATRVDISQSWTIPSQTNDRGESVSRTLTVWYAPDVKRAVKVVSRGGPSRTVDTQYELELLNYRLQ